MIEQMCFSNALLEGSKEVFETMIFMDLTESTDPEQKIEDDSFLGSITFRGEIEGCLAICCGAPCAKNIATNMLGMDSMEEISREEICDALGEVTNMVMGSVKSRIQDHTGDLQVSIPTVVMGRKLQNSLGEGANRVMVKVSAENEYLVEFSFLYRESSE
jgi:chemotaxis protein CheX